MDSVPRSLRVVQEPGEGFAECPVVVAAEARGAVPREHSEAPVSDGITTS